MAQYIYTMNRVAKMVPPKRYILRDISLSFFPGAKIGVLGHNGAGKSTLLQIMAGLNTDILGEARTQPNIKIGYLPQEPELDESKTVREVVEEGVAETKALVEAGKDREAQPVYICPVCGFTVIGDPPEKCPVSRTPSEKFVKF